MKSARKSHAVRSDGSIAAWVGIVTLAAASAALAYSWSERNGYVQLTDLAGQQLNLHAAGLDSELGKYDALLSIMELHPDLLALLQAPTDVRLRKTVNVNLLNLSNLSVRSGAMTILVMDAQGQVLAASNWYEPANLIASDLSSTDYYREAVGSGQSRTFVANAARGSPECYFARAIMQRGQIVGVTVVKISLESIEASWIEYTDTAGSQSENLLLIDENNVVIMSSKRDWKYKTVVPLEPARREALAKTGRYVSHSMGSLDLVVKRPLDYGTQLVSVPGGDTPSRRDLFAAQERKMVRPGWRLMTLSDVTAVRAAARNTARGAAAIAGLVGVLCLHLLQRRKAAANQQAAHEALERAHDDLEARVEERTHDLQGAIAALLSEVTERKRTELELRQTQNELIQAGRLALLGQMSAAVTHEINQPLTALRAASDNVRRLLRIGRAGDVERNLQCIADLTERMGRITAQLKSFARKAPPIEGSVALVSAITNALQVLETRLTAEHVEVRVDVPESVRVPCDSYRLEQVLLNLFGNAIDAMKDAPLKRLTICATPRLDRVHIRVADTGTGISDSVMNRLFEPFFSTKPPGEGLGLGLVISSRIVSELDGILRALNVPGGAAFEFDLGLDKDVSHA